jgi:hypothetical protein
MGFSAPPLAGLAEEYILIDISLSTVSWCDLSSQRQLKYIQLHQFFLSLVTGLDVTQNISPAAGGAESPGRCAQFNSVKFYIEIIILYS